MHVCPKCGSSGDRFNCEPVPLKLGRTTLHGVAMACACGHIHSVTIDPIAHRVAIAEEVEAKVKAMLDPMKRDLDRKLMVLGEGIDKIIRKVT